MFKDYNDDCIHHETQSTISEVQPPQPHQPGSEPIRNESPLNATPPMFGEEGYGAYLPDMDEVGLDTKPENALEAQNPPISNENYSKGSNCGTRSDADAAYNADQYGCPCDPKE